MANLTPMMRQYFAQKAKHPDCLLFFRLGDFYEMFGDDALTASKALQLTLTTRDRTQTDAEMRMPMCGVPHHSATGYIAKLIAMGHKVAVCEQMEDPASAKGLVERDVVRVITPGTALDGAMLDETANNYIASAYARGDAIGVCFADVSTGVAHVTELSGANAGERLAAELERFAPREIIAPDGMCGVLFKGGAAVAPTAVAPTAVVPTAVDAAWAEAPYDGLERIFGARMAQLLEQIPAARGAVAALMRYLSDTQKRSAAPGLLRIYNDSEYVELDARARRNLELTASLSDGGRRGSLLGVLDDTRTPMGARLLRDDIERPLRDPVKIDNRLAATEYMLNNAIGRGELRRMLKGLPDIERMVSRVEYGQTNPRELRALGAACARIPDIRARLAGAPPSVLQQLHAAIDPLTDLTALVIDALADEPPAGAREGGLIRDGYHPEVDRLRGLKNNSKGLLAGLEARERAKTGVKNLKVGYNRVFGYYIEVTKSNLAAVPDTYIRKQTLAGCERYVTGELKELETSILSAQDSLNLLEYELFSEVVEQLGRAAERFRITARALARLDVLLSHAETASRRRYCRPEVDLSGRLDISDGRHPVVEAMQTDSLFVPNDVSLGARSPVVILTGPNMAGKSTYMRQTALIAIMAHIGSFVPARSARIGVIDKIFTRIGAQDDLAGGRSTFMVEMTEVAHILKNATKNSLLILDEIGRGTSTFDGMAVARAVLERVAARVKAKTLFATHYHELTVLEGKLEGVRNFNVSVKKRGKDIVFLRKIVPGGADDSYGVEVARLAGLPEPVIERAAAILEELEAGGRQEAAPVSRADGGQISMGGMMGAELIDELREMDLNTLTPLEALQVLFTLRRKAGDLKN
ncbi:MAG: DNA mismatch repair protein MutS [Oscillospiraceae bacterium]|nr:DNA mismatch repair protein MutS [Oscillospiraceae bacterium]